MDGVIVSAVYCDDIRNEMGGKKSYMGVYNSDMVLPSFPSQIEKLCIQVVVRLSIHTTAKNLTIRVLNNGDPLADIPLPEGQLQTMRDAVLAANIDSPLEDQQLGCQLSLQFPNLQLMEPGVIRLLAVVDGVEVRSNGLRTRLATPGEREMIASL